MRRIHIVLLGAALGAGDQLRFTEVEAEVPGRAHLDVDYALTVSGDAGEGRYADRGDGSSGQMRITWGGTAVAP